MDLRTFQLLQQWDAVGVLPIRIYAMASGGGDDAETYLERGPFQGRLLAMRAVKFFMDGALGSRGAALFKPYSDEPKNRGLLLMEEATLENQAAQFMKRGFQVCVHAIGDRANALALDALSAAAKATGARNRIEHAQILREEDVPRFAQLGIIASMQPTHATSDMAWAEKRLGPERLRYAYAWKTLLNSGARMAFGSDFPVEDPNPLWGIYSARTRQDHRGRPEGGWNSSERLSGEEALAAFTTGAAYASFSEDQRGMVKEGMDADFVALSVDPIDAEPAQLLDGKVLINVVAGREVFRAPSLR
jgi:predicted amidohydrolase YtcJ